MPPVPYDHVTTSWSHANVRAGRLPARYGESIQDRFHLLASPALKPGVRILDVGSGRDPTFQRAALPPNARYVGLDVSHSELLQAPDGAYSDVVVNDVGERMAELEGGFDVIVSWQVLEHVASLKAALDNMRAYLRPGGLLVAEFSGSYSAFALGNRLLPARLGQQVAGRLLRVDEEDVFPAHYDRCSHHGVTRLMTDWTRHELTPYFRGAVYFRRMPPLLKAYLSYENWIERHGCADLATHYLLVAEK
jgi:cyclopropane fatty-acyl-phospholipid synthase-like methyltransferase